MSEKHLCELCGEPMPEGEEMFKYHGYSCNCPKPPLEKSMQTAKSNQVDLQVMPNEVIAGDITLEFCEDTEEYNLWCEIVNEVYMGYDTTNDGSDAENLINKIEKLLKLVSQREA